MLNVKTSKMEETGKPNGGSCTQTVDDVINEIGKSPNILLLAVATLGMSCSFVGCLCAYMVVFTGFIPTENYVCLTKECQKLQENFTLDSGESKLSFISICPGLRQKKGRECDEAEEWREVE